MDAFELLKKDHQKVSQLFSEIESASGEAKTRLFKQLKAELDLHAHIEETVLYPALEKTDEAREITLEAYEEHKVVKDLLGDLAGARSINEQWDAKLTVLKENVEHHVKEEEGELFNQARKALSEERIETLGADLEAEKARQTGAQPRGTRGTKKAAAGKSANPNTPGVLQRLATFIGLTETPAPKATGRKKSAGRKKSETKSTTAKSESKTKVTARSSAKASKAPKSAKTPRKAAAKPRKSTAKKATRKTRTSTRASSRKAAPSRARTSASKSAARPASNQQVKAGSRGRKVAKSSARSTAGTRKSH